MNDLLLIQTGHAHGDVGPVRAHIHAVFAYGLTSQAAGRFRLGVQIPAQLGTTGFQLRRGGVQRKVYGFARAQNVPGCGSSVRNSLYHSGGAAARVADHIDAGRLACLIRHGAAALVHGDAIFDKVRRIHFLADGGDHGVRRELHCAARGLRAATTGGVGRAQLHDFAGQNAAVQCLGRHQITELHAVGNGQFQFFRVGRHVTFGAAVDQAHVLHTLCALSGPSCVHGSIAASDDHHIFAQIQRLGRIFLFFQKFNHVQRSIPFQMQRAVLPGAVGYDYVGVALSQQGTGIGHLGVQLHSHAQRFQHGGIVGNGLVGNAERGDHVLDDTAQRAALFKHGHLCTAPGQQMRRGHTGGTAAHNSDIRAAGGTRLERFGKGFKAVFRSLQLGRTDVHGLFVEVAGTLGHAGMAADGAGDERQRIFLADHPQRILILTLAHQAQILGNVLMNGALLGAGRGEAVDEGNILFHLTAGQRLHGLDVVYVRLGLGSQRAQSLHVHAIERFVLHVRQDVRDGAQPVVSAGFQQGGGHGDGPHAAGENIRDVVLVRAAGIGYAQLAVKLFFHALGQGDGQRIQALAAHVHLFAGQLARGDGHGEGIGQLHAELHTVGFAQRQQTAEHGDGVGELQVRLEVMVIEHDVVVAHVVHGLTGKLIT